MPKIIHIEKPVRAIAFGRAPFQADVDPCFTYGLQTLEPIVAVQLLPELALGDMSRSKNATGEMP
jgi:hypothetical protein